MIGLGHQHGGRFIVLWHQYGRRDVMRKHTICTGLRYVKAKRKLIFEYKCYKEGGLSSSLVYVET